MIEVLFICLVAYVVPMVLTWCEIRLYRVFNILDEEDKPDIELMFLLTFIPAINVIVFIVVLVLYGAEYIARTTKFKNLKKFIIGE